MPFTMPTKPSAIPGIYYAIFAWYEPLLCLVGFIGAFFDPKTVRYFHQHWRSSNDSCLCRPMINKRHGHRITFLQDPYLWRHS